MLRVLTDAENSGEGFINEERLMDDNAHKETTHCRPDISERPEQEGVGVRSQSQDDHVLGIRNC